MDLNISLVWGFLIWCAICIPVIAASEFNRTKGTESYSDANLPDGDHAGNYADGSQQTYDSWEK